MKKVGFLVVWSVMVYGARGDIMMNIHSGGSTDSFQLSEIDSITFNGWNSTAEMIFVPAGTFTMGDDSFGWEYNSPEHQVTLTHDSIWGHIRLRTRNFLRLYSGPMIMGW